jgi:hypothetical protein
MAEFKDNDNTLYVDVEDGPVTTIQIVEGRTGPNAIIVLSEKVSKDLLEYLKFKIRT